MPQFRPHMGFETEFHIFCGQGISVVEFDPFLDIKIHITPVRGDLPGFGHGRQGGEVYPHIDQTFKNGSRDQRPQPPGLGGRVTAPLEEDAGTGGIDDLTFGCSLSGKWEH